MEHRHYAGEVTSVFPTVVQVVALGSFGCVYGTHHQSIEPLKRVVNIKRRLPLEHSRGPALEAGREE